MNRKINYSKKAIKQIGKLQPSILRAFRKWQFVIAKDGIVGLKKYTGFKDHSLKGELKGKRSSYLSKSFRVIYSVKSESEIEIINVVEVNNHEYKIN